MMDTIKDLFNSKKINNNNINLTIEEEVKLLRKENNILKEESIKKVLEKFKTRRSIRKFSDQKIDSNLIFNILEGSINAPCAGNIQNYKILVIEDENKKRELGKLAFQQFWLSDAPVILVIVRDNYNLSQLYPKEGKTYAIQNCAALIENILMLTHFYDLGACWVEAFDNEVLKEYLKIPQELVVDAIIPIGYPLENPKIAKETMVSKVFFESFGNKKK